MTPSQTGKLNGINSVQTNLKGTDDVITVKPWVSAKYYKSLSRRAMFIKFWRQDQQQKVRTKLNDTDEAIIIKSCNFKETV